jgi:hypothetical protein
MSRVASALNEWSSNNNGAVFTAGAGNANLTSVVNSAGNLSQYTLVPGGAVAANSFSVTTGTQTALPAGVGNVNLGSIRVVTGATCGTSGATVASTSTRRTALQFLIENNSGVTALCQEAL